MKQQLKPPTEVRLDTPNPARIYDYLLGGAHNFAVDRETAERMIAIFPDVPLWMRANRAFLRRVTTFLAESGVEQFLDIGSGMPTVGNVHTIAHAITPHARIVYVDNDPLVARQSEALVGDHPLVAVIEEDARNPEVILDHPAVRELLDFQQPIAVTLVGLLHFVTDDSDAERVAEPERACILGGIGRRR